MKGVTLADELLLELTYQCSMQDLYEHFCDLPGFVLLESTDKKNGRYDILSACPYDRVQIHQNTKDKLAVLNQLQQLCSVTSVSSCDLPFQGGAIGYISYDLGAQLVGIESSPQPSLSSMPLLDFGLYDWAIIVDHHLKKSTLYAANTQTSTAKLLPELIRRWHTVYVANKHYILRGEFKPLMSKERYEYSFAEIYKTLKQGRSYQVNLTQPFHAEYEGNPWGMYRRINASNPVPYAAFLRMEHADIVCCSPERFLLYEQGKLLTSPIKGTIKRSADPIEDERLKQELLVSAKNRAENIMIVDLLRNDLGKIAKTGSVQVLNLCTVQSFNAVHHLVSDIIAEPLDTYSMIYLLLSCFPGGSITGAPKLETMRIIHEQELYARGVYCGGMAYFSRHGRFDSNIAIRTIVAKENLLHLAAGGGIVIDSECEDEYRECFVKIEAIINGLCC